MSDASDKFTGGTWQRYKLGQAQFTRWLKQTYDKLIPIDSRSSTGLSKRAQKRLADVPVHWRELEIMSAKVTEVARLQDIPTTPISILRDVIGLRKKSAKFFSRAGEGNEKMQLKNATHQHIIDVLERVLGMFEGFMVRAGRNPTASTGDLGVKSADLNNMFEHLKLHTSSDATAEDSDSDVENKPVPSKSKKGGKKKVQKKKKQPQKQQQQQVAAQSDSSWIDNFTWETDSPDDDDFDYYMMIYCFFEDFNTIRSYVVERWCDYYFDRSVSLNTLAVITNAAFELYSRLERTLILDMRRIGIRDRELGHYEYMMMAIFTAFGMEHVDYEAYDNLDKEEHDARIWKDEWEWLASPAFSTINNILEFIPPGKTPMIRKSDRSEPKYGGVTNEELNKFKDVVICDLLYDVVCVKAMKKNGQAPSILPAESELLLGFQDALRNYDFSSAFIFSMQTYIDIRYVLEDKVVHSFQQMQRTAQKLSERIPRQLEWANGPRYEMRRPLRQRQSEVEHVMLNDVVHDDKMPRYLNAGLSKEDVGEFSLLKHEPIWAGLMDLRAKIIMNELGHQFVATSIIVEAAACLYVAARLVSDNIPAWKDMDQYLASYADDSFFKRCITQDTPAAIFKMFKDVPMEKEMTDMSEEFQRSVRVRSAFSKRYTMEFRSMEYLQELKRERLEPEIHKIETEDDVDAVLKVISGNKLNALALPASEERRAVTEERLELKQKWQQKELKRRGALLHLSPIQELRILEDAVNSQLEGLLALDFGGLMELSHELLSLVGVSLGEDSRVSADLGKVVEVFGERLSGDAAKDEGLMSGLVRDVTSVFEKSVVSEDEWEDVEDDGGSDEEDGVDVY